MKTTLGTSVDVKTALETSVEDDRPGLLSMNIKTGVITAHQLKLKMPKPSVILYVKLHSERVEIIEKYTRNEWKRLRNTLETSGKLEKVHSKIVSFTMFHLLELIILSK